MLKRYGAKAALEREQERLIEEWSSCAIGLMAFATLLLSGTSYAADKIVLTCSGTESIFHNGRNDDDLATNTSLVIDLDKGVVSGLYGCSDPSCSFTITEVTETIIKFKAEDEGGGEVKMHHGEVNRITGELDVIQYINEDASATYSGTCKPASAFF
jgi:hypothetical protein